MPEISIIIPVFNAERFLCRCLDSVLRQTFRDYRVILVNDGSRDSSLTICREYGERDARFIVLDKTNGGAASARNLGLDWNEQNAPGDWLCFLDADDFVHERYLELLLAAARNSHTRISMCNYLQTVKDSLEPADCSVKAKGIKTETLWCERQVNCTIPVAKLFAADVFRGLRFPEGIIHEDEFTLYKALFQCETIAFLDLPLYGYYQTETSVMRGAWTPRHMSEPDGLLAQLRFFLQNNYKTAAAYTAKIYLFSLCNQLLQCRAAGDQYSEYAVILKKRLQRELVRFGRTAGLKPGNAPWLYYEAFPHLLLPYRAYRKFRKTEKSH